jgi:S1-C subfamily serine protease
MEAQEIIDHERGRKGKRRVTMDAKEMLVIPPTPDFRRMEKERGTRREKALRQAKRASKSRKTKAVREQVAAATVRLTKGGGQGVLVPGDYILTAAHCIPWPGRNHVLADDDCFESVHAQVAYRDGGNFQAELVAADPVADIAVLAQADSQQFEDDAVAFEKFANAVTSVPLWIGTPPEREFIPVLLLTHKGTWTTGVVTQNRSPGRPPGSSLCLDTDSPVLGGTSGGPVVDLDGRLIGVVSRSTRRAEGGTYPGMIPLACLALPRWVADRVAGAGEERQ